MRRVLAKLWSVVLTVFAFLALAGFQNCGQSAVSTSQGLSSTPAILALQGKVTKSNLDGCQYLIAVTDATTGKVQNYVPLKMDSSLLIDGNVVTVVGTLATDTVTSCMAGPILQVQTAVLVRSN